MWACAVWVFPGPSAQICGVRRLLSSLGASRHLGLLGPEFCTAAGLSCPGARSQEGCVPASPSVPFVPCPALDVECVLQGPFVPIRDLTYACSAASVP